MDFHRNITSVVLTEIIRVQPGFAGEHTTLRETDIEGAIGGGKGWNGDVPFLNELTKLKADRFLARPRTAVEERAYRFTRFTGHRLLRQ